MNFQVCQDAYKERNFTGNWSPKVQDDGEVTSDISIRLAETVEDKPPFSLIWRVYDKEYRSRRLNHATRKILISWNHTVATPCHQFDLVKLIVSSSRLGLEGGADGRLQV